MSNPDPLHYRAQSWNGYDLVDTTPIAADGETVDEDHGHSADERDDCDLCILDAIIGEEEPREPVETEEERARRLLDDLQQATFKKASNYLAQAIAVPDMMKQFYPELQKAGKLTIGDLVDYDYNPATDSHHYNPKGGPSGKAS